MSPPPKCPAVVGGRSSALTLRWPGAVPLGAVVEIARDQSGPKAAVPSEPGAFLRARERHVKSDADKELVFNLLDAATWYWIRTRQDAEQNNQYSRMIAVRTPAARPAPVLALDASYTLYDDSHAASARGRHMFVKLKWRASDDRGADIEEYIVQRCSVKEPDWKIVYRTTSCACVLSAMVSVHAFNYACTFAVTARNAVGLSRETVLDVAFAVPAAPRAKQSHFQASATGRTADAFGPVTMKGSRQDRRLKRTRRLVRDYLDSNLIVDKDQPSVFRIEKRKISPKKPAKQPSKDKSKEEQKKHHATHKLARMATAAPVWRDATTPSVFDDELESLQKKLLKTTSTKTSLLTITTGPDREVRIPDAPLFRPSPPATTSPSRSPGRKRNPYRQKLVHPNSTRKMPLTNESNRRLLATVAASPAPSKCDADSIRKSQLLWTHTYETQSKIPLKQHYRDKHAAGDETRTRANRRANASDADFAHDDDDDDEEEEGEDEEEEDPFVRDLEMLTGAEAFSLLEPPSQYAPNQQQEDGDENEEEEEEHKNSEVEPARSSRSSRSRASDRGDAARRDMTKTQDIEHDPDDYYETIAAQRLSAISRAEEAARAQALAEEAEAKQRAIEEAEAERARLQAEAEAEEARLQAEAEAERLRLLAEQARIEEEARAKAEAAAQEKAATLLQSHARASISRQHFQRQMREIVRIQAFLRMLPPRRAALRRRSVRKAAAHFMSCVIVTAQRHCEEENRVMVDVAAIRLQSRFRQFGAKRKMTRMLEQKHAAIMLQKHVRTHMTRKSISKQQTAATVIQARFRSHQEQVRFEARVQQIVVRAAIRLQACYRAHHAQKQLGQRKRHILKSIVRVNVTDAGTRSACGSYEQMEVTDAAKYIMTAPGTDDTYLIERSEVQVGQVPIWTLKLVKGSGETHLLYVNKLEGGSLKPPVRSWEAISGRPPAPSLVCKTSDSYLKDMELMNREAVVVTDSGCAEVHGRYFQSGVADGVPQFVMQKAGATYSLLRSPYADRRIWLLVGSLMFHIDETDEEAAASGGRATSLPPSTPQSRRQSRRSSRKDSMTTKRIYFVNMENGSAKKPPLDGWQVAQHGKLPEPLFVRQRKLQAEDE